MSQSEAAAKPSGEDFTTDGARWANGARGFGNLSRALHWTTAFLVFALVALGLYSKSLADGPWRETEVGFHKSLGLLLIALTLIRLGWIAWSPSKAGHGDLKPWEQAAARAGHALLYVILLLMPLSGLLMSEGAGRATSFFGLFDIPPVLPVQPGVPARQQVFYKAGKWLHDWPFQWALYTLFALHIAAVIKHQWLDGDRSFLTRMWGRAAR